MRISGLIAIICLLAFPFAVSAQNAPVMSFESTTVDYGEIERGAERLRTVSFTNTGDSPLVIKNARGSCGCTVPDWPKDPIMPGETSELSISYDTNRLGNINRTIRVTTNEGSDPHVLLIRGKVVDKKDNESVPKKDGNMFDGN